MVSNVTWEVSGVGNILSGTQIFSIYDHKYESKVLLYLAIPTSFWYPSLSARLQRDSVVGATRSIAKHHWSLVNPPLQVGNRWIRCCCPIAKKWNTVGSKSEKSRGGRSLAAFWPKKTSAGLQKQLCHSPVAITTIFIDHFPLCVSPTVYSWPRRPQSAPSPVLARLSLSSPRYSYIAAFCASIANSTPKCAY